MKKTLLFLIFFAAALLMFCDAAAEGGCPPGQYPIGGQGALACAPIPQDNTQKQPRPSGRWIKTWGAIASDSGDNLGVSVGKIDKSEAQQDAVAKCTAQSGSKCHLVLTYRNQCAAIAEPYKGDRAVSGMLSYNGAASKEIASADALSFCKKDNPNASCRIIYTACSEPVMKSY